MAATATPGSMVSGLMFGTALAVSGVASPQVIRDQLRLSDYHMLVTFLTASASSAAILLVYNSKAGDVQIPVRSIQQNIRWLGRYDGHIVGGAMLGLGMGVTGACPGTVLVQAAAGIENSRFIALGSLVGAFVFSKWKQSWKDDPKEKEESRNSLMSATGWSANKAVLVYDSVLLATTLAVLSLAPRSRNLVHPITGGLLIGLSQFVSVVLTAKSIGVSAAYGEAGKAVWHVANGGSLKGVPRSVTFALATIVGAKIAMLSVPGIVESLVPLQDQSMLSALVGGFLLTFGASIAGGCTSGHGISGMAGMSLGSFVTVAAMFTAGILSSLVFT